MLQLLKVLARLQIVCVKGLKHSDVQVRKASLTQLRTVVLHHIHEMNARREAKCCVMAS